MKKYFLLFLVLLFSISNVRSQRVGLVLSGGGARGIAHIGLIQALEDNDIPIDYITGTSMGAIVASMYAMGYTTEEMIDLILSDDFQLWQSGKIDDKMVKYFLQQDPTPGFINLKIPLNDSVKSKANLLPVSLIKPQPMSFAFLKLFANATERCKGDFDNLFVPIRTVSSDIYNKKAIISSKGDLGKAVRASMSFPFVFKPIELDSVLVLDGGIYDNFPVQVMKDDFAPEFIIGSVVSKNPLKPTAEDLMSQIDNLVMQKTNYDVDSIDGVSIKFDLVGSVSLLDMQKAPELYEIGYNKGLEYIDYIKERVPRRVPKEQVQINRNIYRSTDPEIIFDDLSITGINQRQAEYVKKQFQKNKDKTFDMALAEKTYFGLLSDSKVKDITPDIERADSGKFLLNLNIKLSNDIEASIGGFITSMNANRIYMGAAYRFINNIPVDLSVGAQLGRAYNSVNVDARIMIPALRLYSIGVKGAYWNQKYYESDKLFSIDNSPCFINQKEMYAKLELAKPVGTAGKLAYHGGYGYIIDEYYQNNQIDFSSYSPDQSRFRLWNVGALLDINRIKSRSYATDGFRHVFKAGFFTGHDEYIPSALREEGIPQPHKSEDKKTWLQLEYEFDNYLKMSKKFVLGTYANVYLSNKPFYSNYNATLIQAKSFMPLLHSQTVFNAAFRANDFVAIGVKPIFKLNDLIHFRTELYAFQPLRKIVPGEDNVAKYADFKFKPEYMGEISAVCKIPFATISAFVNYYSHPKANWNIGLNIGFLINTLRFCD